MNIYLFLENEIKKFNLPLETVGSFSFDINPDIDSKLINIEAQNDQWVLYSTADSKIMNNNDTIDNVALIGNNYYILRKNEEDFLIYIVDNKQNLFQMYSYDSNLNLIVGNTDDCTIRCNDYLFNGVVCTVKADNNVLIVEGNNKYIYIYR